MTYQHYRTMVDFARFQSIPEYRKHKHANKDDKHPAKTVRDY